MNKNDEKLQNNEVTIIIFTNIILANHEFIYNLYLHAYMYSYLLKYVFNKFLLKI